jgi:pSer/pThr/pTyr-binding forkhead associated (FHA) protein
LNSTNGTYLNGARIGAQQLLHVGDVLRIGDTELRFEHG